MEWILMALILALVIGFGYAQRQVYKRERRRAWRIAALLPSIVLAVAVLNIVVGVSLDKTSHNLWPFEVLMCIIGGLMYLGVLRLIRR